MLQRISLMVILVLSGAAAPAQEKRDLNLKGDRFTPLAWEAMNAQQQAMVNEILGGPRTSLGGPFNALLRSPEMGNLTQRLGEYLRFRSSVPARLNEMAILLTARAWSAQYEWHVHKGEALKAGLSEAVIDDIQAGRRPGRMQPDETVIYDFSRELRERKRVSDAMFKRAVDLLGERGVIDLIAVLGYYDLISMVLNVDRYPLPEGELPPFAEPR